MTTTTNVQWLQPCVLCPTRMATPGGLFCVRCAAELTSGIAEVEE